MSDEPYPGAPIDDEALSLLDKCLLSAVQQMGESPEATRVWRNLSRMTREERELIWYSALVYFKAEGYTLTNNPKTKEKQ